MDTELKALLVKDLGLTNLTEEAQDQILARLGEITLKAVTFAIFEKLPEAKRAEFDEVAAAEDPAKIQAFLTENIPNLKELMDAELKKTISRFKEADDTVVEPEQI